MSKLKEGRNIGWQEAMEGKECSVQDSCGLENVLFAAVTSQDQRDYERGIKEGYKAGKEKRGY